MKKNIGLHEHFQREEKLDTASDRGFGLVMAAVFLLLAAFASYHNHVTKALILLVVAVVFLFTAIIHPERLSMLNLLWTRFGLLLHKITNPILMLLIYLTAIVPMGLLLKLFGKDPLNRKFQPYAESYWITRQPGPLPETMRNQF